jgi:hypothetical protein
MCITPSADAKAKKEDLESYFVYVAENAAKTAYNCSGSSAPFDHDSFDRLLKCEKHFMEKLNRIETNEIAPAMVANPSAAT